MGTETIFNENTILSYRSISIGGYTIPDDELLTYEVQHDFFTFAIIGRIVIKDSYDFFNKNIVKLDNTTRIIISLCDFMGDIFYRTFRIVDSVAMPTNDRFKTYTIQFIDEISFILSNAYIGKGFTASPITAFETYMKELSIGTLIDKDKLSYLVENKITDKMPSHNFIVPQNTNVLDFFFNYFRRYNVRLWQDRKSIYINEVKPANLSVQTDKDKNIILYSNNTLNNEYMYKIHDFHQMGNPSGKTNETLPIGKTYRFSKDKKIVNTTINLNDILGDLLLNNKNETAPKIQNAPTNAETSTLQQTTGEKLGTQTADTLGGQIANLFDVYMQNNRMLAAVPGSFKYSNVGRIVKVELKGNPLYPDTALEGDKVSSGKYFISAVSDRIIGDKLIQRLTLNRIDQQEPRKSA